MFGVFHVLIYSMYCECVCVLVFACLLHVLCLVLVCAFDVCAWCMLGVCVCVFGWGGGLRLWHVL